MAHLIDKDAAIAEIERIAEVGRTNANVFDESRKEKAVWLQQADVCDRIISFINTLEVKNVDLEKELIEWHKEHFKKDGTFTEKSGFYLTNKSQMDIAKRFFELGLKVNNEKEK